MNEKLLAMYLEHASTDGAMAILFVKKNMQQSAEKWVDIITCERYESSEDKLHFRFVEYELYKRTLKPKYPPKSEFTNNGKLDEESYYTSVRAVTWEVANLDCTSSKPLGHKRCFAKRHFPPILSHLFKRTRVPGGAVPVEALVSAA